MLERESHPLGLNQQPGERWILRILKPAINSLRHQRFGRAASLKARHLRAKAKVSGWSRTFGTDELDEVWGTEAFHPIPVMDTLLALLTIDEDDLAGSDDDDDYED
ncbi:MAG: hypothetical protein R3B96_14645 [Pirellulaceae bacterium]